jgi:hypothetical protein
MNVPCLALRVDRHIAFCNFEFLCSIGKSKVLFQCYKHLVNGRFILDNFDIIRGYVIDNIVLDFAKSFKLRGNPKIIVLISLV